LAGYRPWRPREFPGGSGGKARGASASSVKQPGLEDLAAVEDEAVGASDEGRPS